MNPRRTDSIHERIARTPKRGSMILQTDTTSAADKLIERIKNAAPDIEAQADENERIGCLNKQTIGLLSKMGVFEAMAPADCGGADLRIYDVLRVYEALSYVDCAAGWVAMIPGVQGKSLLLLDDQTRKSLSAHGYPFIAGQGAPQGRAIVTEGGYRISGRWSYGSAILHCDTVTGVAVVVEDGTPVLDDDGTPKAVVFFTPAANARMEGNWDVLGLRATGSVDYSVSDVFVPIEHTAQNPFTAPLGGDGQAKYLGFTGWTMLVHCAVPLGAGRRLLDELATIARVPNGRGVRLADDPRFAHGYGKAEAAYRSARALMYEAVSATEEYIDAGQPATRRHLTDMRAASVLIHDVNAQNATFAVRETGGISLRASRLQRLYRDIVAMGQHVQVSQPTWAQCAKDYLGEAEGKVWALNRLV